MPPEGCASILLTIHDLLMYVNTCDSIEFGHSKGVTVLARKSPRSKQPGKGREGGKHKSARSSSAPLSLQAKKERSVGGRGNKGERELRLSLDNLRDRERYFLEAALNCFQADEPLDWLASRFRRRYRVLFEDTDIKYLYGDRQRAVVELRMLQKEVTSWLSDEGRDASEGKVKQEVLDLRALTGVHAWLFVPSDEEPRFELCTSSAAMLWGLSHYVEPLPRCAMGIFYAHVKGDGLYMVSRCKAPKPRAEFKLRPPPEFLCGAFRVRPGSGTALPYCSDACRKRLKDWERKCRERQQNRKKMSTRRASPTEISTPA